LGESVITINKKRDALFEASKKVGLEVVTETVKYMVMSRHQNAGQNHNLLRINL